MTVLYRPVGQAELDLIAASDFRGFPPRLPGQPIFYPVCNEEYAKDIATHWNVRDGGIGYVLRFEVDDGFLQQFDVHVVGSRIHSEYWVPADKLTEFNEAIIGKIEIVLEVRDEETA